MRRSLLSVFLLYSLLTAILTFPLITKMSAATYGYSGDNFGAIHYFWWWKYTKLNNLTLRDSFLEEAPFGVTLDNESGAIFYYWPMKALTLITNEVFAYNFILLLGFPLAGLAMYLLMSSLVRRRGISFIAGFIFAFAPYHFWKAYNHLDLSLIWPLPVYVWSVMRISEDYGRGKSKRTLIKDALIGGIILAVTFLTNFYYGYFMLLFTGAFFVSRVIYIIFSGKSLLCFGQGETFKILKNSIFSYFIILVTAGLISAPFIYPVLSDARQSAKSDQSFLRRDSYQRPILNLLSLSARPWDYFIPSADHPVFGPLVPPIYEWIKARSDDFKTTSAPPHERTIFLGWTTIILALTALVAVIRKKNNPDEERAVILPVAVTGLILFLFSLPPYIFLAGRQIYLPTYFLYQIFPMFRTYARLGVVVLLLTTLLAGWGIKFLLEKAAECSLSVAKKKILIFLTLFLIGGLVFFEFINVPPAKIIDFSSTPPEYDWLAKQPGQFSILEWPISFNLADALLFQRVHKKGIANWHSQSPYYDLWRSLPVLYNLQVTDKIAALGVRYVVVHKKLIFDQPNPVDDLWYTRAVRDPENYKEAPANMEVAANFDKAIIFEVTQPNPAKMAVIARKPGREKPEAVVLGEADWPWQRSENRLYLINLVEKNDPRPIKVRVTFNLTDNQKEDISISFNGETLANPFNPLELNLQPFENDLWFTVKDETQLITVKDIKVEIIE